MDTFRILAINPGSTSTKIVVYDGETALFSVNLQHSADYPALLGCQIARDLADLYVKPSYMVNAPSVDEFINEARFSGMKEIRRISHIHALNQKKVAIRYANSGPQIYGYESDCMPYRRRSIGYRPQERTYD